MRKGSLFEITLTFVKLALCGTGWTLFAAATGDGSGAGPLLETKLTFVARTLRWTDRTLYFAEVTGGGSGAGPLFETTLTFVTRALRGTDRALATSSAATGPLPVVCAGGAVMVCKREALERITRPATLPSFALPRAGGGLVRADGKRTGLSAEKKK